MRLLSRPSFLLAAALVAAAGPTILRAQDNKPAPPAIEAKAAAPASEAAKPEGQVQPEPRPVASKERKSRRQQDARHCLEQPTNTAIIKCAEAYL